MNRDDKDRPWRVAAEYMGQDEQWRTMYSVALTLPEATALFQNFTADGVRSRIVKAEKPKKAIKKKAKARK